MSDIKVSVVYALPEKQHLICITLKENSTVEEAVLMSGLLEIFHNIDLSKNEIGIYGRQVKLMDKVKDGDRVEIYRPLIVDPKEQRRKRVKKMGKSKIISFKHNTNSQAPSFFNWCSIV